MILSRLLLYNRNCARIVFFRYGKWRRRLAKIFLRDSNQELIHKACAVWWDRRSLQTTGVSRILAQLIDDTGRRLTEASASERFPPGQVAGKIVARYFEQTLHE